MPFKEISSQQTDTLLSALRSGNYNLLLGAGSSMDATNKLGQLPSGTQLKNDLCDLKSVNRNNSLQRVFALLTPTEVKQHIYNRFVNCTPGPTAKLISSFVWKRIFTWNIDDVLEQAYKVACTRFG